MGKIIKFRSPERFAGAWWRQALAGLGLAGFLVGVVGAVVVVRSLTESGALVWDLGELAAGPGDDRRGESPASSGGLQKRVVILDPGHGGKDGGAVANGLLEKDLCLDVALRTARRLRSHGREVLMSRGDDRFLDLDERAQIGWKYPRGIFVSIHFNSAPSSDAAGVETYFTSAASRDRTVRRISRQAFDVPDDAEFVDRRAMRLAENVQSALTRTIRSRNRGVRDEPFYVTKHSPCPSILVECAFITNPAVAASLAREARREKIAAGLAAGIQSYLDAVDQDPLFGIETESGETIPVRAGPELADDPGNHPAG